MTEAELLKRIAAADGDCALAAAAQSVHRSSMLTPNDHDPGVSTKSEVGKVPPQLKCARFRAERGSDSHDLAVRSVSSCDLSRFVLVGKGGTIFT